jgi:uncharacterized protein
MMRYAIPLLLALFFIPTCASAEYKAHPAKEAEQDEQQFENGLEASNRHDYAAALAFWQPLANQGYAKAEFKMGVMYEHGRGVPQDYAQALAWYEKAADGGVALACTNAGWLYTQGGYGIAQDDVEALKWYRRVESDAVAQYDIGSIYEDSPRRDYPEAIRWFRKSADQGYWMAQLKLGEVYEQGEGVTADGAEAAKWLKKAAELNDNAAQTFDPGGWMKKKGTEGRGWYRTVPDPRFFASAAELGKLYKDGKGVKQDDAEAYFWLSISSLSPQASGIYAFVREEVASNLSTEQRAAADRRVQEWMRKHPMAAAKLQANLMEPWRR